MSSGCSYDILGQHRYEKTIWFNNYLDVSYPENQQEYSEVPGVGHNNSGMFTSEIFKNYLRSLF